MTRIRTILINKGDKFGRLTVIKEMSADNKGRRYCKCKCICGNIKIISASNLHSGKTKSCGCLSFEIAGRAKTHGELVGNKSTTLYNTWLNMKSRCYNEQNKAYNNYGGRGIKVCKKWLNNFEAFAKDMGPKPDYHTIERINNNKGYYPWNCKWAIRAEQNNNTRKNVIITHNNKNYTIKEACKVFNISKSALDMRRMSLPESKWLIPKRKPLLITYKNKKQLLSKIASDIGISKATLYYRVAKWPKKYWFKPKNFKCLG